MTLSTVIVVAAAVIGVGVYGALSQQSFVMIMMGLELIVSGVLIATVGFWAFAAAGAAKGQVLAIVALTVMAVEMAIGFALVINVYRVRQADTTEATDSLKH
ncbi:MAG TPA: NADH-quinone oxidoreductase subunit K [Egibacteraceae bacterium]|nr:NADH-quinone oxidoreductase subunit K [Egibacteraceae bacterium]